MLTMKPTAIKKTNREILLMERSEVTMREQHNSTTIAEERQKQTGLWAAGIFAALSAAFMVISIYAVVFDKVGLLSKILS